MFFKHLDSQFEFRVLLKFDIFVLVSLMCSRSSMIHSDLLPFIEQFDTGDFIWVKRLKL